jgi:hypothetical protein
MMDYEYREPTVTDYVLFFVGIIVFSLFFVYACDANNTNKPKVVTADHRAVILAAKACSCYGDTKNIDYREKEFDFYCNDGVSYGKFIPYTMVYQGENCVGNP